MSHTPTRRRTAIWAGAATVVAVAVAIGWAVASSGGGRLGEPPAAAASPPASAAPATPAPGGNPPTQDPAAPPATDPGQQPGSPPSAPAPPGTAPAGPQIEQFRVVQQPACPGGTDLFPVEGQPVVLEWQVTGADQVTLSIDGPGAYGSYPGTGGETLSFGCAGAEGDLQQHTYLLTATAGGATATETLVVSAEVHERQNV